MKSNFATPPWTQAEEAVMRRVFPEGGVPACVKLLPGRTYGAIQVRANKLRVFYLKRKRPPKNGRHGKPPVENQAPLTVRRCLRCRIDFRSDGIHNRVCRPCKNGEAWQSGGVSVGTWA